MTHEAQAAALEVRGLQVRYHRQTRSALKALELRVEPGRCHALVGRSGAGKSTFLAALQGLLAEEKALIGGQIDIAGAPLLSAADHSQQVGSKAHRAWLHSFRLRLREHRGPGLFSIFQEPRAALNPYETIAVQLNEALAKIQSERSPADILAQVDLRCAQLDRRPDQLSVGMCQRVQIAFALALGARVVLADEPLARIDPRGRGILRRSLRALMASGSALVLVTHDPSLVRALAQEVTVLDGGRIIERGQAQLLFAEDGSGAQEEFTRRYLSKHQRVRTPVEAQSPQFGPILATAEAASRRYSPRRGTPVTAIEGACLSLNQGETLALVGESGGGKTTLARLIGGLEAPSEGSISLTIGQASAPIPILGSEARRRLATSLQLVFQEADEALDPCWSVLDSVAEPYRMSYQGISRQEAGGLAGELLGDLGLAGELIHRSPSFLSGGERKRAALARALSALGWGLSFPEGAAQPWRLLILDEPLSGLDPVVQGLTLDILEQARSELGLTRLWITHDLGLALAQADRLAVAYGGRLVELIPRGCEPRHPFTRQMLRGEGAQPEAETAAAQHRAERCRFETACDHPERGEACVDQGFVGPERKVACWAV